MSAPSTALLAVGKGTGRHIAAFILEPDTRETREKNVDGGV
jgi:hypothetical protein